MVAVVALIAIVIFAVHFTVSTLFDLEEVRPVYTRLKRLISKPG
ncbi:MAG: hypothetical protein WDN66_05620 [Candidatus Saccharibacteria bacterium]